VLLAPGDATFYDRLADKIEDAGGDSLPVLRRAAELDPANAERRMRLGQRAELAGDLALAERSLLDAAGLSRLYQPKYLLAGYYFRRGNADLCIRWSHAALQIGAPARDISPVLNLLDHLLDPPGMAAEGLREPPAAARQFLTFLVGHGRTAVARELARRLSQSSTSEDLPALLAYCNQSLADGNGQAPTEVWNALCQRRLVPYQPLDVPGGVSLTNSGFDHTPIGSGFDWHAEGAPGLRSVRFRGSLEASFSGGQPDDCVVIWEYVLLEPGARYRLRQQSATPSGLVWRLFYPGNGPVWGPLEADLSQGFRSPAAVGRLALVYRRPSGSTRLSGEVSITGLRLDRQP